MCEFDYIALYIIGMPLSLIWRSYFFTKVKTELMDYGVQLDDTLSTIILWCILWPFYSFLSGVTLLCQTLIHILEKSKEERDRKIFNKKGQKLIKKISKKYKKEQRRKKKNIIKLRKQLSKIRKKKNKKHNKQKNPPRYDEVYFDGIDWLDEQ